MKLTLFNRIIIKIDLSIISDLYYVILSIKYSIFNYLKIEVYS